MAIATENCGIPFLADVLIQEDTDTIEKLYTKLTPIEKRFLFDRANVPLKHAFNIEKRIKNKIKRICKRHDSRRKT